MPLAIAAEGDGPDLSDIPQSPVAKGAACRCGPGDVLYVFFVGVYMDHAVLDFGEILLHRIVDLLGDGMGL